MNTLTFSDRESVTFTVEKNRFTRFFSKTKTRTFSISEPPIGVLHKLFKYEEFINNTVPEEHETISEDLQWKHAEILAVAVLRASTLLPFSVLLYTIYFKWKLSSYKLVMLTRVAFQVCNWQDFVSSSLFLGIPKNKKS
jgi:hypothetical protein